MTVFSSRQFPILFRKRWTTTGLADAIQSGIDVIALCREYDQLRKAAPSRSARNKPYFVGHDRRLRAKDPGSPSEEHLAIALWRLDVRWPRAGGGRARLLDYQFPLKASNSDERLGKVDLLGATDEGRLVESRTGAPTLGSGGDSGAFAPGLSPAPIATFPAPALRTRRADFRHRALQWDHAPRTRTAGKIPGGRWSDSPDIICGRGTASALRSRLVSGEPSSLFTPRRHRTCAARLLHFCM